MGLLGAAYDPDGQLLYECNGDGCVTIKHKSPTGEWETYATIEHELYLEGFQGGAWAHPVFGRVLAIAAGSYVTIWVDAGNTFEHRCTLPGLRSAVTGISFAPYHQGLRLAAACADGYVRVYLCQNGLDASDWLLEHKFECQECCSVSFSPSRAYAMLAVGVKSGSDVPFRIFREDALGWREWEWARTNKALAGQEQSMGDTVVAFATDEYRSFDLLAYVEKDAMQPQIVRIDRKRGQLSGGFVDPEEFGMAPCVVENTSALVEGDDGQMGRVEPAPITSLQWNSLGTQLATSGQDVRIWRAPTPADPEVWRCVHVFTHSSHLQAAK